MARERCAQALREYRRRPDCKLLLTGGYGAHFNTTDRPHAFYLQQHLVAHGIPATGFLPFAESTNTLEDASLSYPIAQEYGAQYAIVVTSDYHEARARYIFERTYKDIELSFSVCATDPERCEFDLELQKRHEAESLERLKQRGLP